MALLATTTAAAAKTTHPAHAKASAGSLANTRPNTMGEMMRAMALMAESTPMTVPRRVGGTHCMRRMGTAGVKRGRPET